LKKLPKEFLTLPFVRPYGAVYDVEDALRADLKFPKGKHVQDDIYILRIPAESRGRLIVYDMRDTEPFKRNQYFS